MKVSKVIQGLIRLQKEHGDIETTIYSDEAEQSEEIHGFAIATENDLDSKVIEFNICSKNIFGAFSDNAQEAADA